MLRLTRKQVARVVEERQRYSLVNRKSVRKHMGLVQQLYYAALEDGDTTIPIARLAAALDGCPDFTP
jgi:hypothetical protein